MTLSRRNVIIGGVAATWIVLLLITFLLVRSSQENQRRSIDQITPTGAPVNREATETEKTNLLMNRSELEEAERDYNSKIGKQSTGVKRQPKFNYQLAPSLKQATEPTPEALKRVLAAATTCNIDSAPQSVYVYDLKSHWAVNEAQNLAREYGVDSPSYSLPSDTNTFQYQFTNKDNSAFFNLFEASGKFRYHKAGAAGTTTLDEGALRDKANAFVTEHKLNNKIQPPAAVSLGTSSLFTYKRVLDDFRLTDQAVVDVAVNGDLCNVPESTTMGQLEVEVQSDGLIRNLFNNTRTILGSYKASRISLDQAVAEYGDSQPVDPIVIPPGAAVDTGTVVIDSAVLAYYDMGANFGQFLYMPMYIAKGTAGSAQVVAFFPAVSSTELLKKGLIKQVPASGTASTQQQGTIPFATPTSFAPPPPPASGPVAGGGVPGGGSPGGGGFLGCPGGLVDYQIQCGVAGRMVCAGAISAPSSSDPLNACASGCKNVSGTVTYQAGGNPCDAFLQQKSIPAGDRRPINFPGAIQQLKSGDQVTCSLNACPC